MMSNTSVQERTFASAIRHVWKLGGFRAYYRGLSVCLVKRPNTVKFKLLSENRLGWSASSRTFTAPVGDA